MDSIDKGSTIANLVSRFREAPPANKTMRMKSSEFWWNSTQSPQHASQFNSLCEADSDLIANYVTLPDAYVDIPCGKFELESPVPVSKIAINTNEAKRLIVPTNNHNKVTKFNSSADILQEWRSKRKREAIDYRTSSFSSPKISTNIKKQNYYEELTNKYLPNSIGTQEHSVCNPITHSPPHTAHATGWLRRDYCTNAETSVRTTDAIPYGFSEFEACPRYNADTNNESVASVPIENLSEQVLIAPVRLDADTSTTDLRKQLDVSSQTKHLIRSETRPVRIMTNQSVQTSDTKEVEIQTTPLQSPPTRELLPVPPASNQELEDTTLWSISSMTSEGPSDYTETNRSIGDRQTTAERALEGIDENDSLTLFEDDELIQLLVGKARFYEQHIENINALLNKDN